MNKEKNNSIILTGLPGSGKSTVGKFLSDKTGFGFIDLDSLIEETEGLKITEIFAKFGEKYFRTLETDMIKTLKSKNSFILSTGGGTFQNEDNILLLKNLGTVFYLNVSPDIIYERIKGDRTRPLLNTKDPKAALFDLLLKRDENYKKADYTVNAAQNVDDTANEILNIYEKNKR
ncbi:TPA: shikimate kinase [Candidatus Galligastranaerophilus gallistercoris]|nr:shikimate kinase [Candidatus Galligastranaerophilus gallistercoris]